MKGGAGRALKMKAPASSPRAASRGCGLLQPRVPRGRRGRRWSRCCAAGEGGSKGTQGAPTRGTGGAGGLWDAGRQQGFVPCTARGGGAAAAPSPTPLPAGCPEPPPHTRNPLGSPKEAGQIRGPPPRAVLATQGFGDRMWPVSQGGQLGRHPRDPGIMTVCGALGAPQGAGHGAATPPWGSSAGSTSPFQAESGCAAEFLSPACPLS